MTIADDIKLLRIIKSKSDCKMLQKDTVILRDRKIRQQIQFGVDITLHDKCKITLKNEK